MHLLWETYLKDLAGSSKLKSTIQAAQTIQTMKSLLYSKKKNGAFISFRTTSVIPLSNIRSARKPSVEERLEVNRQFAAQNQKEGPSSLMLTPLKIFLILLN